MSDISKDLEARAIEIEAKAKTDVAELRRAHFLLSHKPCDEIA